MRIKSFLIALVLLLECALTSCAFFPLKPTGEYEKSIYLPSEVFDIALNLTSGDYSENEYCVSGYVIDTPTEKNDKGTFSFTVVDDLRNTDKPITVFLAESDSEIKRFDKVTVRAYLRNFGDGNATLMGKSNDKEYFDSVEVLSVLSNPCGISETLSARASNTVTMLEMTNLLAGKKAHYPLSDEFSEKYQQTDGGYLDNADKADIPCDRQLHEPNQKWHFFESWFYPSIDDGSITWDADAKSRVYSKLLCPELLLWIYEACGVEPVKVRNAMLAAEAGKTSGLAVTSIAKNMRSCVAWDDLAAAFTEKKPATSVTLDKTELDIKVGDAVTLTATSAPLDATETPAWTVVDGNDTVSITADYNKVTVLGLKDGTATVRVSYNASVFAECRITVKEGLTIIGLPETLNINIGESKTLSPQLNKENGSFTFTSDSTSVATVGANGIVSGLSSGSAIITVASVEHPELTKTVKVNVIDPTAQKSAIYNITYDLGSRKTAKLIENADELFNTFTLSSGSAIISSVSAHEYIYGGGNGGRSDTAWYTGNMLKFGTTSVKGSLTLALTAQVNYIKITGYVYDTSCKIKVGDTAFSCSSMNTVSKDTVTGGQTSTVLITFTGTDTLTIETTTAKPLFITSIEIGFDNTLN